MGYGYESGADGQGLIVARTLVALPEGAELAISYGGHPDFVFGAHYGFVPPLLEQPSSCYTVLRLDQALHSGGGGGSGCDGDGDGEGGSSGGGESGGEGEGGGVKAGLGAEAVREAQRVSEEGGDVEAEAGWCEWSEAEV